MELLNVDTLNNSKAVVATVGFFDGVHLGHRYLISQLKAQAKELNLPAAVITFPTHPRKVLSADYQPALLCGYQEKIKQLATTDIDYCFSIPFSQSLAKLSAKQFMQEILKNKLNVHTLLVGYDHRFGHNREDGIQQYIEYGKEIGINVLLAKELDTSNNISSSAIRRLLSEGKVEACNRLLSYRYTLSGKIVKGFQIGRTIGFPTANIEDWEQYKVIPALGIYAVYVYVKGDRYKGMLYIGNRPTLHNGDHISVEVNLFDFDGNLYDEELTVEFLAFIRFDKKFDSLEELKESIAQDRKTVLKILQN